MKNYDIFLFCVILVHNKYLYMCVHMYINRKRMYYVYVCFAKAFIPLEVFLQKFGISFPQYMDSYRGGSHPYIIPRPTPIDDINTA